MAIVFVGALIAFGVVFPTAIDSTQQVGDAHSEQSDQLLDRKNTDISINETTYDETDGDLVVTVDNEGTTALEVSRTDVIVDGDYRVPNVTAVAGDDGTDVWQSGETVEVTFEDVSEPSTVKVVTASGNADRTDEVTVT